MDRAILLEKNELFIWITLDSIDKLFADSSHAEVVSMQMAPPLAPSTINESESSSSIEKWASDALIIFAPKRIRIIEKW